MGHTLSIRKTESIRNEVEAMDVRIRERAYELFLERGFPGMDLDNWLSAEDELAGRPLIELHENQTGLVMNMAVPGVDPRAINVDVTPEDILVTASLRHLQEEPWGARYATELKSGDLFRAVHLPKRINPDKVTVRVENGLLQLTAGIADERSVEMAESVQMMASAVA